MLCPNDKTNKSALDMFVNLSQVVDIFIGFAPGRQIYLDGIDFDVNFLKPGKRIKL